MTSWVYLPRVPKVTYTLGSLVLILRLQTQSLKKIIFNIYNAFLGKIKLFSEITRAIKCAKQQLVDKGGLWGASSHGVNEGKQGK